MLSNQREYTIFIVGLLIGFVAGYLIFGLAEDPQSGNTPQGTDTGTDQSEVGTENGDDTTTGNEAADTTLTLSVNDQASGMSVAVAEITLTEPAWVAISEKTGDGTTGNILGAKLFPAGTTMGDVMLLRRTVPNEEYYASVYKDDGDHEFEFDSDDVAITDSDGHTILVEFTTFPTSPN